MDFRQWMFVLVAAAVAVAASFGVGYATFLFASPASAMGIIVANAVVLTLATTRLCQWFTSK